ncbi:MAG TPA: hypothetical protein VFS98_22170, partial [Methylomirabilota bacterium]|nr:hypothetical protein [Methylomirabilota bacterium]
RFKVYIVDEVHMLSGAAFNAFLKTLEEPPPHVVFILATTDPKKIPATVLSRCQRFDFRPIPPELLATSLTRILEQEGVPFEPGALPVLIRAAEGSLRDALSLLDTAIAYGEGRLDEASVARLLGSSSPVHVRGFVSALLAHDGAAALEAVDRAAGAGEELGTLCREAIEMTRRLLLLKVAPGAPFADLTPAEAGELKAVAEPVSADELVYVLRAFLDADAEMRRSPHPRVELEIAVVRATRRPQPQAIETLIGKLEEAEARLRQMPLATGGAGPARPVIVQETLLDARPAPAPPPPRAPAPTVSGGSALPPVVETAVADMAATESALPASTDLELAWERVVADVMKRKALLGSVLQHASPLRVAEGVLTLALQASGFHREMLNDRGNKELINEAVQRHVAAARRFELDANGGAAAGGARSHPAVQAALNAFQGEVVAVRPRSPEEGESR